MIGAAKTRTDPYRPVGPLALTEEERSFEEHKQLEQGEFSSMNSFPPRTSSEFYFYRRVVDTLTGSYSTVCTHVDVHMYLINRQLLCRCKSEKRGTVTAKWLLYNSPEAGQAPGRIVISI